MELNKIYNMNCIDGLKMLENNSIDLTVTSPPYDDLRNYNGYSFDFEGIAKELYRVTKDGGVVVWVVNDSTIKGSETGTSFQQALYFKECGFNLHDTMIWYKGSCPFPDKTRYYQSFEYMFIFSKGKPKVINLLEDRKNKWSGTKAHGTERRKNGETAPLSAVKLKNNRVVKDFGVRFNVWEISPERNNKTGHPAVFPEQVANDHILSWSNEGDIVLDPFMGSGTTAKMSILNNRNYIGFEISKEYCEISKERIESAINNKVIST